MNLTITSSQESLHNEVVKKALTNPLFREKLLGNPVDAIQQEFNIAIPNGLRIKVIEEEENTLYLKIPKTSMFNRQDLQDSDVDGIAGNLYLGAANTKTCSQNTNHCN